MKVLNINEVEGEKLGENTIRRILVYSKKLMLMYSEAEPGGPPIAHSHPHEQMGFIIQGTSELTAGGKTVTLKAGSSFLLEPNEYHEIQGVGNERIRVLDIFHPYREDYVSKK
jgi:quercetin dioxygenase-like cupin family protein